MTVSLTTIIELIVGGVVSLIFWMVRKSIERQDQMAEDIHAIKTDLAVQSQRLHSHLQSEEASAVQTDKRISEIQHDLETHRRETREDMAGIYARLNQHGKF